MSERTYTIPVDEGTLKEMVLLGGATLLPDGSYEITPKFEAFLKEWCELRIPPNMRKEDSNGPHA